MRWYQTGDESRAAENQTGRAITNKIVTANSKKRSLKKSRDRQGPRHPKDQSNHDRFHSLSKD